VEKHWRLIGWGMIQAGTTIEVPPCPLWVFFEQVDQLEKSSKTRIRQDYLICGKGGNCLDQFFSGGEENMLRWMAHLIVCVLFFSLIFQFLTASHFGSY
jgi:hypothetical protein